MSGDLFSNGNGSLKFEPWYEREKRTWLEFRNGCKGRIGKVCYLMDAKIICGENSKDECPLWFMMNFRSRPRRDIEAHSVV